MSKDMELPGQLGNLASSILGKAIDRLKAQAVDSTLEARVENLRSRIGDALRQQSESDRLPDEHAAAAKGVQDQGSDPLARQDIVRDGLQVTNERLGEAVRGIRLQAQGLERLGKAAESWRGFKQVTLIVQGATQASARYQAQLRDAAIRGGIDDPERERQLGVEVQERVRDVGMSRELAFELLGGLSDNGMSLDRARGRLGLAGSFAFGQGASARDTARLFGALDTYLDPAEPAQLGKTLDVLVLQGKSGVSSARMAGLLPELLRELAPEKRQGAASVRELGALLQLQSRNGGGPEQAAADLKAWIGSIGSKETVAAFAALNIDYGKAMKQLQASGMSRLQASLVLAQRLTAKGAALPGDKSLGRVLYTYQAGTPEYLRLSQGSAAAGGLEQDRQRRADTSESRWQRASSNWKDAQAALGDAMRPYTDPAADLTAGAGAALTRGIQANPGLAAGGAAAVTGLLGAVTLYRSVRGTLDILRGGRMAGRGLRGIELPGASAGAAAGGIQRVFVTNWPMQGGPGGAANGTKRRGRGAGRRKTGAGGNPPMQGGPEGAANGAKRQERIASMRKIGAAGKPLMQGGPGGAASGAKRGGRGASARKIGVAGKPPMQGGPGGAASGAKRLGRGASMRKIGARVRSLGRVGTLARFGARRLFPVQAALSLYEAKQIHDSDQPPAEKAAGYGNLSGSLAGSLAGAALGASIGSVVPVVGTLIGGLLGGAIGAWGGGELGGRLGRSLVGETPASNAEKAAASHEAPAAAAALPIPAVATPNWTFAPQINLTVQGNVHEPRRLADELLPYLQRMLADFAGERQRRSLYDPAMVV